MPVSTSPAIAVPELKDYPAEKLDAAQEIQTFAELVTSLDRAASARTAQLLCQRSRTMRIAIEVEAWETGYSEISRQHRQRSLDLLGQVAGLETPTLSSITSSDHAKVRVYFEKMARRCEFLAEGAR
ncbi:MAG: hypothetical protein ABMA13_19855 [Chthoniobacteraceae bacterium]